MGNQQMNRMSVLEVEPLIAFEPESFSLCLFFSVVIILYEEMEDESR
jgi:hypothetical protein